MADANPSNVLDAQELHELRDRLSREVMVMLRYALEEGLELDPSIAKQLGTERLADQAPTEGIAIPIEPPTQETFSGLMTLHNALVKAVTPATPCSLEATAPAPGLFGFLLRPPLIGAMVLAAVICSVGFVYTLPPPAPQGQTTPTRPPVASVQSVPPRQVLLAQIPTPLFPSPGAASSARQWNWLFAAGLGAAFFGLFTAHEYVKNRTFDPRYNSVYLIRFVLGVVAGLILANLGTLFDQNETFRRLGPGVIALLGGFSAEAVNQVLQRLVEIMVAVVKGGSTDVAKAREEQLKTKLASQLSSAKQSVSQDLANVLSDPQLPAATRNQLKDIQAKLAA